MVMRSKLPRPQGRGESMETGVDGTTINDDRSRVETI